MRSQPPFTGVLRGPGPESAPGVLFECFLGTWLRVPQRVLFECFLALFFAPKTPKSTRKALFGALGARCPKTLKKHSGGHFRARAPEHSCKWRLGFQFFTSFRCGSHALLFRTHRIGAACQKPNSASLGVLIAEDLVNSVFCCLFLGKTCKVLSQPRFSKPDFRHSTRSTTLDRPLYHSFQTDYQPTSITWELNSRLQLPTALFGIFCGVTDTDRVILSSCHSEYGIIAVIDQRKLLQLPKPRFRKEKGT